MSQISKIEWTDATWNPVRGCTKVSPGCAHCYAETFAERWRGIPGHAYEQGFDLRLVPEKLDEPLHWRKPRLVFVNSMSDLFHEDVPDEFIDRVFAVMAFTPRHTYQVLTKRPERMARYLGRHDVGLRWGKIGFLRNDGGEPITSSGVVESRATLMVDWTRNGLPNVWLGTSVENQKYADERIPHLLRCPAAVRFLSCEPLLGTIDNLILCHRRCGGFNPNEKFKGLVRALDNRFDGEVCGIGEYVGNNLLGRGFYKPAVYCQQCGYAMSGPEINWVIVGGESGPGARPCDVAWIRSIRDQCKAAGVPVFVKQLGSNPVAQDEDFGWVLREDFGHKDKKGGDPSEWPEDLRVREYPKAREEEPVS